MWGQNPSACRSPPLSVEFPPALLTGAAVEFHMLGSPRMEIETVEMHTGGEPTRIVVAGWPRFQGATLLDKRREARERWDDLRRGLMHEPRGHAEMYGALLVP